MKILVLILPWSGNCGLEIQYKGSVFCSIWHMQELQRVEGRGWCSAACGKLESRLRGASIGTARSYPGKGKPVASSITCAHSRYRISKENFKMGIPGMGVRCHLVSYILDHRVPLLTPISIPDSC